MKEGAPHKSYIVAKVREALAEDPRLNVLDIQVTVTAGKVFLLGEVASEERRKSAEEVACGVLGDGFQVVNNIRVVRYAETSEPEQFQ